MRAAIDYPPVIQNDDLVGERDGGEAMGDDEVVGPSRLAQSNLDLPFGSGVDRGGRVIQDQNPRLCQQRPCDRDPLALPPESVNPRSPITVS